MTPIFENDTLFGYESVRAKPNTKTIQRAQQVYDAFKAGKKPKLGYWFQRLTLKGRVTFTALSALVVTAAISFFIWRLYHRRSQQ